MTPDIETLDPVPTTNTLPAIDAQWTEEVQVVEQHLFFHTPRSKDNNISTESTRNNDPTKRLDKVEGATGRIVYNITNTTLEININILLKDSTKLGHSEDKLEIFTNDIRAYFHFRDILTCPKHSIKSVVFWLLNNFWFGCTHTHANGPSRLLVQFTGQGRLAHAQSLFSTSAFL